MPNYAIGIDLGGTKINAGIVDEQGRIELQRRFETPIDAGGAGILDTICQAVQAMQAEAGQCLPVGVGSPGLVEFPSGIILGCTPNLPDWLGVSLRQVLRQRLNTSVIVDNDANAAAWGEFRAGKAVGTRHAVMLTLGTGLGSGIITDKRLLRGYHGLGIGFGHLIVDYRGRFCNCGQQGCLEAYVSGKGLVKGYQLRGGDLALKGPAIFDLAAEGEPLAQTAVNEMLDMLAVGVANILNTFAPELVVIGGGISAQGEERLLMPLRAKVARVMSMPLKVPEVLQLAALGPSAGLIGAGLLALDYGNEIDGNTDSK